MRIVLGNYDVDKVHYILGTNGYVVEADRNAYSVIVITITKDDIAEDKDLHEQWGAGRSARGEFFVRFGSDYRDELRMRALYIYTPPEFTETLIDGITTGADRILGGLKAYCEMFGKTLEIVDNRAQMIAPKKRRATQKNYTFGIEIEAEHVSQRDVGRKLGCSFGNVHGDGSLVNGTEVSMVPLKEAELEKVKTVCSAIVECGGEAHGPRCGGHIHIGANAFRDIKHINKTKRFVMGHAEIFQPISGRSSVSHYAEFGYKTGRYSAVNLESLRIHGTVEFRFWGGTLNADVIALRAKIMKKIVAATAHNYSEEKLSAMVKSFPEYQELMKTHNEPVAV